MVPEQISVKKLKFFHKNKEIDKREKGGIFRREGGFFYYLIYSYCFCASSAAYKIPLCTKMLGLNQGLCDFDIDSQDTLTTWLDLIGSDRRSRTCLLVPYFF